MYNEVYFSSDQCPIKSYFDRIFAKFSSDVVRCPTVICSPVLLYQNATKRCKIFVWLSILLECYKTLQGVIITCALDLAEAYIIELVL